MKFIKYFVRQSGCSDPQTVEFDGYHSPLFHKKLGMPSKTAYKLVNDWNQYGADYARTHAYHVQVVYWIEEA